MWALRNAVYVLLGMAMMFCKESQFKCLAYPLNQPFSMNNSSAILHK